MYFVCIFNDTFKKKTTITIIIHANKADMQYFHTVPTGFQRYLKKKKKKKLLFITKVIQADMFLYG